MSAPLLHHYPGSPFAEKARMMLGFKGLAWRSVTIPAVMPKPDLIALTGGYRRTPVLQVGADIYCDTARIATLLEALQPEPTLFPASAPLAPLFAQWADSMLFWTVIPYCMQPAGLAGIFEGQTREEVQAFAADRKPFSAGVPRKTVADATVELQAHLAALEAQLADGREFLFGAVSIADFALAHNVWFVQRASALAHVLTPHSRLAAWYQRLRAFGHGPHEALDSAEALHIAATAGGHAATEVVFGLGFAAGAAVTVAPIDYGRDPVEGTLVGLTEDEVVLERTDPRAGTLHVHFPRIGYQVKELG